MFGMQFSEKIVNILGFKFMKNDPRLVIIDCKWFFNFDRMVI